MYNYLMLIGRVRDIDLVNKTFKLEVMRPFKNEFDCYENDIFKLNLYGSMQMALEQIKEKDRIAVKGRLTSCDGNVAIIAERIVFFTQSNSDVE